MLELINNYHDSLMYGCKHFIYIKLGNCWKGRMVGGNCRKGRMVGKRGGGEGVMRGLNIRN